MCPSEGRPVIHATENEQELIENILQTALKNSRGAMSVNALVRVLVEAGAQREMALATLHREIASGHVVLTDSFMVAPGR